MPILWGRWYSEEETKHMAAELNRIGQNIEKKTEGIAMWIREAGELKAKSPHGQIF